MARCQFYVNKCVTCNIIYSNRSKSHIMLRLDSTRPTTTTKCVTGRDVEMMYELRQLPLCPPLTYDHHSNYANTTS